MLFQRPPLIPEQNVRQNLRGFTGRAAPAFVVALVAYFVIAQVLIAGMRYLERRSNIRLGRRGIYSCTSTHAIPQFAINRGEANRPATLRKPRCSARDCSFGRMGPGQQSVTDPINAGITSRIIVCDRLLLPVRRLQSLKSFKEVIFCVCRRAGIFFSTIFFSHENQF